MIEMIRFRNDLMELIYESSSVTAVHDNSTFYKDSPYFNMIELAVIFNNGLMKRITVSQQNEYVMLSMLGDGALYSGPRHLNIIFDAICERLPLLLNKD